LVILAPACKAIIASSAKIKRRGEKVPVVAKPSAEPTKTGDALAKRNFGRDARKKITNLECFKQNFINLILTIDFVDRTDFSGGGLRGLGEIFPMKNKNCKKYRDKYNVRD